MARRRCASRIAASPLRCAARWLCVLVLAAGWQAPACAAESLEYSIKATYLYKFAAFVAWPNTAFASADMPVTICVAGADPFSALLDQAVAGQRIAGRPIAIRRLAAVAADSGCHIAFLGGSAEQSVAQGLDALRAAPVLTVTDHASEPVAHGIVNFVIVDNRVRFEIDERAAAQDGIAISSKLLSLAWKSGKADQE